MKKLFKLMTCLIAGIVTCSIAVSSVACSCGEEEYATDVVKFSVWDSGWGTDGYQAIVDAFNAKAEAEGYGYTVEFDFSADQTNLRGEFSSGTSDIDVFSVPVQNTEAYDYLEPLDDILDSKYGNESKTLREKFKKTYLDMMSAGGTVYMLPVVASVSGIVYNAKLFKEVGASVPRTTDELIALCQNNTFNTPEHRAWIHFNDGYNGYYPYIMSPWVAQYMGYDNYLALQNLTDYTDYNGVEFKGAKNILTANNGENVDGRVKMLEVLDGMLGNNTVAEGHSSSDFTTQQLAFLNGKAMMMVNGNWLGQEMQKNNGKFDGETFLMMKMPVISSIIENLPDDSITDDEQLCEVIDAIDAGKSFAEAELSFACTEDDYNRILEARGMMTSGGCVSGIYVANYSNVKEKAKEFLRFFCSDEAAKLWRDIKKAQHAASFDDPTLGESYEGWSSWDKCVDDLYNSIDYPIGSFRERSPFYVKNGQEIYLGIDCINPLVVTSGSKNWQQLWQDMQKRVSDNWTLWAAALEG